MKNIQRLSKILTAFEVVKFLFNSLNHYKRYTMINEANIKIILVNPQIGST